MGGLGCPAQEVLEHMVMSLRGAKLLAAVASLSGVFFLAGCPNPPPTPDMAGIPDLTMSGMDDMATSPADMTMSGCDPVTSSCDMAMTPVDMTMTPDMTTLPADMTTPPVDMTTPPADMPGPGDMSGPSDMPRPDMPGPTDMATSTDLPRTDMTPSSDMSSSGDMAGGSGGIGDPCTADTGCKKGPTPTCWKSNVLNNPMNPATPSGYCSSECTSDAACGAGARCVSLGMKSYCLASCNNATTCRKPGYACSYYDTAGVCFPDTIFDCNTKAATCTESGSGKMGGCIRQAYEDKGTCAASCTAGSGTCASVGTTKRQCIYLDATRPPNSDAWKGLICLESPATAVMPGGSCSYLNDCTDGYQCDGASSSCRQLCGKGAGGMPACTMGTCADAFGTPATGPGLCR